MLINSKISQFEFVFTSANFFAIKTPTTPTMALPCILWVMQQQKEIFLLTKESQGKLGHYQCHGCFWQKTLRMYSGLHIVIFLK